MDTNEQACEATQATSEPGLKRAYRAPEVVEFGDVRELTRAGGASNKEGKFGRKH